MMISRVAAGVAILALTTIGGCSGGSHDDEASQPGIGSRLFGDSSSPPGEGCTNEVNRRRAQMLAELSFIVTHPGPAQLVDESSGCNKNGSAAAGRTYVWEAMDIHLAVTFVHSLAEKDGWTPGFYAPRVGQTESYPPVTDDSLCLTKIIDGMPVFARLAFPDSSEFAAEGDVYDISAWFPDPTESDGC